MLSYYTFFWSGFFSTAWLQVTQIPKFRDCVDVDEGYFIHYFAPAIETKKSKDMPELSTEKFADFASTFKENVVGTLGGEEDSFTREASEEIGDEIDRFVRDAKSKNVVQAKLSLGGITSGQIEGVDLFYFWCGEGCRADTSSYRQEGKTVIDDPDTGISVSMDYENGTLLRDGVPLISNPDAVRLQALDSRGPFSEIPQKLTISCAVDSDEVVMEINTRGETEILSSRLLDCIKAGVLEQTGLPMESSKMLDVFGRTEGVVTTTHPNVTPMQDSIIAEGTPRKIAEGMDSKILINAKNEVRLSKSNDGVPELGKLVSIQFKNGLIVVKPDGCLLMWLKHHEAAILSQNDVGAIRTNLTHEENPETGCPEPALNFEASGIPESDFAKKKAEQFNQSLRNFGPFQIFETPSKRYVLSMGDPPECEEHLRIIDKETGEIQDFKGTTSQTPTGVKFTDEDGKEHTLDFTAKDGVPLLSYNDQKPETLSSMEGRNGSFWYDPKDGLWYAENGQLLPLLDAFRQGISTQVGSNGDVTSSASGNVLNLEFGEEKPDLLNLPSLPQKPEHLILYLLAAAFMFVAVRGCKIVEVRKA
jgi:hypothetical protein